MNGSLFFNRSILRLCHALALDMKARYGIENWSAYLNGEPSYHLVKDNKDIKYEFIVDDLLTKEAYKEKVDEKFLAEKEKEYGTPFLWLAFTADRNFIHNWPKRFYVGYNPTLSHYQIKQQIQCKIKSIEKLFKKSKPDFIVLYAVSNMGSILLYYIARKMGIRCVIFDGNRLGQRVGFTEDIYGCYTSAEAKFDKIQAGQYKSSKTEEARRWLEVFKDSNKSSRPADNFEQAGLGNPVLLLKNLIRKSINSFKKSDFPTTYSYSVWDYVKRNFLLWKNLNYCIPKYDPVSADDDYVFYPLHLDPELSTMVYAPYYTDQLWLVKSIAQSLPINFKLYVKDHPGMIGLRDVNYYNELKKIPNVKLIDHRTNSIGLIKNAKIITAISSTAGWEGVMLGKPLITFGPVFYNKISSVKRCKAMEELPFLVKECLANHQPKEQEVIDLISAMMEESLDIDLNKLFFRERNMDKLVNDPDLKKLSDAIINFAKSGQVSS